jgi:hypothetical protein
MTGSASSYALSFDSLKEGKLGVSAEYGSFVAQAAAFCLYQNEHHSPVKLLLTGDESAEAMLRWHEVGEELVSTWADLKKAAENGAYGIAIVVCVEIFNVQRVEVSAQGTGIDFWLSKSTDDHGIFQRSARLEVSSILHGNQSTIAARLKEKLIQARQSDETRLPAYVIIVEFGSPEAHVKKRAAGEGQA